MKDLLITQKFMMRKVSKLIHIDFESRSEIDIKKSGAWVYSMHPSTEILCVASAVNNEPVKLMTREELKDNTIVVGSQIVCAHNSSFEYYMWHNILVRRFNWSTIPLRQWRCTATLAASHALPRSLEKVGDALNLPVRKDVEGKRIMQKMSKPRKATKNNPAKWHDDPEDLNRLYEYCKNDVEVERAIFKKIKPLSEKEQRLFFIDSIINKRGVQIDQEAVDSALCLIDMYTNACTKELLEITEGALNRVTRREATLKWLQSQSVVLPDLTRASVEGALNNIELLPNTKRVLEIRKQLSKTSTAKYKALKNATDGGGRLRDLLLFYGASTGRWSGKMFQPQNLPRGTVDDIKACIEVMKQKDFDVFKAQYPDVMEAISSCLRGMVVSRTGYDLLVADYASIESRVVLWLADDEDGLNQYRRNEDLYINMAKRIYEVDEITKEQRHLGKTAILGCSYGMGYMKFRATCKSQGLVISENLAKIAVETYRSTYASVKSMWYAQESAAIEAVVVNKIIKCGKIHWGVSNGFLYCRLPSGRCLSYHKPEITRVEFYGKMKNQLTFMGINAATKSYEQQSTWGGTLVENITQSVARDILAEAMVRCEEQGYNIVLHVHDELISEVPKNFGNVEEFINLMIELPKWAGGLPLSAGGWRGKRYKK